MKISEPRAQGALQRSSERDEIVDGLCKPVLYERLFQKLRLGVLRPVQDANNQHVRIDGLEENHVVSVGARAQMLVQFRPRPIDQRCQRDLGALTAQFGQIAQCASRVVLGNVVADAFEIGFCQGRELTRFTPSGPIGGGIWPPVG